MWTLFVVTLLPQIDDAKVTRYAEYKDKGYCIQKMVELEQEFNNLEYAICVKDKTPNKKPLEINEKDFWMGLY